MEPYIIILIALMLAAYNGFFLTGASKEWHATGFLIRAALIVFLWPDLTWMLLYAWVAWVAYDIIINRMMGNHWGDTGASSWIETHIPTAWLWFLKIALTFTTVAFILVNWFKL